MRNQARFERLNNVIYFKIFYNTIRFINFFLCRPKDTLSICINQNRKVFVFKLKIFPTKRTNRSKRMVKRARRPVEAKLPDHFTRFRDWWKNTRRKFPGLLPASRGGRPLKVLDENIASNDKVSKITSKGRSASIFSSCISLAEGLHGASLSSLASREQRVRGSGRGKRVWNFSGYLPPRWDCWRVTRPTPGRFLAPAPPSQPRREEIRRGQRAPRPGVRRCTDRPRATGGRAWPRRAWAAHPVPLQWTLLQEVQMTLLSLLNIAIGKTGYNTTISSDTAGEMRVENRGETRAFFGNFPGCARGGAREFRAFCSS